MDRINATLEELNDRRAIVGIPAMIFIAILMGVGVFGNIAVCYIFGFQMKKTTTNCFILTLGVFDLLCCCIGMPTEIMDLRYPYMFPSVWLCKLLRFVTFLTNGASSLILLVISIDRYRRVCHPLSQQISTSMAKKISGVMTFVAAFLTWPTLLIFGFRTKHFKLQNLNGSDCSVNDNIKDTKYPIYYYFCVLGIILLSFIFMIGCYMMIWLKVQRRSRGIISESRSVSVICDSSRSVGRRHSQHGSKTGKTTLTVFLVTLLFILSFLPGLSVRLMESLNNFIKSTNPTTSAVKKLVLRSYFLSNALNPVIYGFFNDAFRTNLRNTCARRKRRTVPSHISLNMSDRKSS